jgi:predicted metal-dependent phosphoesterase TrpH
MSTNQLLKADLHVHSYRSNDSCSTPSAIVSRCLKTGINCLAITDHNTIEGALEIQRIAPFTVIIGEEIKSSGGDIIGLFLNEVIPAGLTPLETAKAIKTQSGLVMAPHPFDRVRSSAMGIKGFHEIITHLDLIETFNGRNWFNSSDIKATELSIKYKLGTVTVTDSHSTLELGRSYNLMPQFDGTASGLLASLTSSKAIMARSRLITRLAPLSAKLRKRIGLVWH